MFTCGVHKGRVFFDFGNTLVLRLIFVCLFRVEASVAIPLALIMARLVVRGYNNCFYGPFEREIVSSMG